MKTNTIAMLVGSLGLFLFLDSAAASGQCPGQIYGVAAEVDNSLTIAVNGAESNCGCLGNRLILPGNAANLRATHANVLAAFLARAQVGVLYDYDPATPCYKCGACRILNVSVLQ